MGLASFWSSITGQSRIKEIAPEYQTSWLERGRPVTSASTRTAKRFKPDDGFGSGSIKSEKSTATNIGEKASKLGRSLSRSRQRSKTSSDTRPKTSGADAIVQSGFGADIDTTKPVDIPDVPCLPTRFTEANGSSQAESLPDKSGPQIVSTGIAITTDSVEPPERSPAIVGPDTTSETAGTRDSRTSQKRRQSSASQETRVRSASWCHYAKRTSPLPPPSIPLPPIPADKGVSEKPPVVELPALDVDSMGMMVLENERPESNCLESRPSEANDRDNDSILQAFPPVPGLVRDNIKTPESSVPNSEVGDTIDITALSPPPQPKSSSQEKRRPNPIRTSNTAHTHTPKDSAIGTPRTPRTVSGQAKKESTKSPRQNDGHEHESICLTVEQQRDWNKVARMMEMMENQETEGAIQMLRTLQVDADRMHTAKFSNEQALAALEFELSSEQF